MVDLQSYYNKRAKYFDANQQLEQVGHTVSGQAIADDEFERLIGDLCELLELTEEDTLLDLGCGNGRITFELAQFCNFVYAGDFSSQMIVNARALNNADNIHYTSVDMLNLGEAGIPIKYFSKILIYGALQHVKQNHLEQLIREILPVCKPNAVMVFGFVPEQAKRWRFYNTFRMKLSYLLNRCLRRDVMGTWWQKNKISNDCEKMNITCDFVDVPPGRYGYPYRFHVVVRTK